MAHAPASSLSAGVVDLLILKTSWSAFTGFMRDAFTTLPETNDRLLATSLTAPGSMRPPEVEFGPVCSVRQTMLQTFAAHESASVAHTIHAMGEAVIAATPDAVNPSRDAEQASRRWICRALAWRIVTKSSSPPMSRMD